MRNPAIDSAFPAFSAVAVVLASTVFGLLLPPSAAAQVYRCEAADGRITYTNERCPSGARGQERDQHNPDRFHHRRRPSENGPSCQLQ